MFSYKKTCVAFLTTVACAFVAYVAVMLFVHPLNYLDGEAAWYYENNEFSKNHKEYVRILIIGDSVAKAGFHPKYLDENSYNFALGGASPMEEYIYLREYLKRHEAPKVILCGFLPEHLVDCSTFWVRSVYFHRISYDSACEVILDAKNFKNTGVLNVKDWEAELGQYIMRSPRKYGMAVLKTLRDIALPVKSRSEVNREIYNLVKLDKGHCYFGRKIEWNRPNQYAEWKHFNGSDMMVEYLYRLIDLCISQDIKFIYCAMPMNNSTYDVLKQDFKTEYLQFLSNLQEKYPDIIVETYLRSFDNDCFGDATHLNEKGSKLFSNIIRAKYIGYLK